MTVTRVVRYVTRPECAEENARLVGAVFEDLAVLEPEGLDYQCLRLEDGLTFVHVATMTGEGNPLLASEAFRAFSSTVADRCAEGPVVTEATTLGHHRDAATVLGSPLSVPRSGNRGR